MTDESRNWLLILGLVLSFLIVVSLVGNYWLAPMIFEEQRQAGEEIAQDTYNAENAVDEYEWFRTQWHDIKAVRDQINNTRDQHKQFHETYGDDANNWSYTTKNRHSRIHDRLLGLKNTHDNYVAEYNARSEMANRAIFKCGLPYEMQKKFYISDLRGGDEYVSEEARNRQAPEDASDCKYLGTPPGS